MGWQCPPFCPIVSAFHPTDAVELWWVGHAYSTSSTPARFPRFEHYNIQAFTTLFVMIIVQDVMSDTRAGHATANDYDIGFCWEVSS